MRLRFRQRSIRSQLAAALLAAWFALVGITFPSAASAVLPVSIVTDIPAEIRHRVENAMRDSFKFQLQLALLDAFNFFGQRLAYESAVFVASGFKGQDTLIHQQGWAQFLSNSAFGAGLTLVNDLDKIAAEQGAYGVLGFDGPLGIAQFVCAPTSPQITFKIKLGLQERFSRVQPLCSWRQFKDQWSGDNLTALGIGSLQNIGVAFEPGESDISAALELHTTLGEQQAQRKLAATEQRREGRGFKGVEDIISGSTLTPASVIEEETTEKLLKIPTKGSEVTNEQLVTSVGSFEHFPAMLLAASEALLKNTLAQTAALTFQKQLMERGLLGGPQLAAELSRGRRGDAGRFESAPGGGRAVAQVVYADIIKPRSAVAGNYDPLTEFSTCDPQNRLPQTCVVDGDLTRALRRTPSLTVAEAIREGALHRDWVFVPPADRARNQDPNCHRQAYCYGNLVKLRYVRALPVGWELAASHPENRVGNPVTLGQVVDAFDQDGGDGACDGRALPGQVESPFCGLIDPNWVLRIPDHQCLLRAPTDILLRQGSNVRAESCVDQQSCLATDGEGRCTGGYGYCAREANVWRLGGTSCPAAFSSCTAYTDRQNRPLAVLTSTVDRAQCTAENAGCRWYATARDARGNWIADRSRRYLNKNAEACTEEGCTELLPLATAGENLVANGSFEVWDGAVPRGWARGSLALTRTEDARQDGTASVRAEAAADVGEVPVLTQSVEIPARGMYTVSAWFALPGTGALPTVQVGDCVAAPPTPLPRGSWFRVQATCALAAGSSRVEVRAAASRGSILSADAIQLEAGGTATPYHDGYAPDAPRRYLKVASDDLRCDDRNPDGGLNRDNDDPRCSEFARACAAEDVGCQRYQPTDGAAPITGTVTDADRCPAACVGYAAFREIESPYDARDAFDFFIPGTARQCTAADQGCSEFTNLDRLGQGGESRESYTFLRLCRKPTDPDADAATYYTWEGSGEQGFQLRSFRLRSNGGAETPPWTPTSEDCGPAGTNRYRQSPILPNGTVNPLYDPVTTPDCRAFYTQGGQIHHRRLSETVVITDACVRYRLGHVLDAATCTRKGGAFENGACVFRGTSGESQACAPAAVGCRAYRGNSGGVLRTILASDFEPREGDARQEWSAGGTSAESLVVGGQSLSLSGASSHPASELRTGGTYELTLIGKGSGRLTAVLRDATGDLGTFQPAPVSFGTAWQRQTLGPLLLPADRVIGASPVLALAVDGSVLLDEIVLREAPSLTTVVKGSWVTPPSCDRASVAPNAPPEAQGMLGCRAYVPAGGGAPVTLRSFTRLCAADVVGCTAFADTRNSAALGEQAFNAGNDAGAHPARSFDNVIVPADRTRFLVDDPAKACQATSRACRRVGLPTLDRSLGNAEGRVTGYTDALLKDDPDRYTGAGAILCAAEGLFCEEYRGGTSLAYFKDPGNRTCEYKTDVLRGGVPTSGWFKTGTEEPCGPILGGTTVGILKNADAGYAGWAATCAPSEDQCTEFRDPTDRSSAYPDGRTYYAIRSTIDRAACAGGVSREEGCVVLDDTSNPTKIAAAAASYAASEEVRGTRVPAVDCDRNPAACRRCVQGNRCQRPDGTYVPSRAGAPTCTTDADCERTRGEVCTGGGAAGARCADNPAVCDAATGFTCRALGNDGNLIVKVARDRQCSQWYEKDGCSESFDPRTGRFTQSCAGVQLFGEGQRLITRPPPSYLTLQDYQRRDRSWAGQEYAGYAIPGTPGLEFLEQVTIRPARRNDDGTETPALQALAAVWCPANATFDRDGSGPEAPAPACGPLNGSCPRNADNLTPCGLPTGPKRCVVGPGTYGRVCATAAECGAGGRCEQVRGLCFGGQCTYGAFATQSRQGPIVETNPHRWEAPSCRAYPETDAPFPRVAQTGVLKVPAQDGQLLQFNPGFEGVRLCDEGFAQCQCSYQKAAYGSATRYYQIGRSTGDLPNIPLAVCVGGVYDGKRCDQNDRASGDWKGQRVEGDAAKETCQAAESPGTGDGTCQKLDRNDPAYGLPGYCLERDSSTTIYGQENLRACLTYYPVDQLQDSVDLNHLVRSAGYIADGDTGRYYCTRARGNAWPDQRSLFYPPEATLYWIAARLESTYNFASDDEQKALFTNARGSGDTTGLEYHPIATMKRLDCDRRPCRLVDAPDNRIVWNHHNYDADDPILDRRPGEAEGTFWATGHGYRLHMSEIEKIVVNEASFIEEGHGPLGELSKENQWMRCTDYHWSRTHQGNAPVEGEGGGTDNSQCWGTGGQPRSRWDTSAPDWVDDTKWIAETHDFNEDFCDNAGMSGIHAVFDAQGWLLGFQTGYCHDTAEDETFGGVDIYFVLREMCTEVREVWSPSGAAKPWTDRVIRGGGFTVPEIGYDRAKSLTPYGSAQAAAGPAVRSSVPWLVPPESIEGQPAYPAERRVPAGAPYSCGTGTCVGPGLQGSLTPAAGEFRLHSLFALFSNGWQWANGTWAQLEAGVRRRDISSTVPGTTAPVVSGVGVCDTVSGKCREDDRLRGTISVNGINGITDSGIVRGAGNRLRTTIQFFFAANENQMPVRGVAVDWGDGGKRYTATDAGNSFQNHRGLKPDGSASMCDGSNFGRSPEACTDSPFRLTHTYTCTEGGGGLPPCAGGGRPGSGQLQGCWDPAFEGKGACVFVPRVHVKDNWGWCTGRCPGGPGGDECYDASPGENECRINDTAVAPWIPFAGRVIVIP